MKLDDRKVVELPLDDILPNRFQPRITFSEDAINELAESIKEHGVIQPIVVRKINDKYEIIAGERRYKASTLAGKNSIPAIVTDLNDKESAEIALIENVQREDLTAIEEAVSYKKILDMGYLTQEELSGKLGKKQSTISNKLRLLNLDEEVQEALLEKKISERHARSLLKLNPKEQRKMLNRIISERLTVRKTDAEIGKILHPEKQNEELNHKNEEIEVLSLEEGEKDTMNNEFYNNFNVPEQSMMNHPLESNPVPEVTIENDNSYNIPTQPIIEDINPIESMTNNPGFMDVNKIAETATDINVEKPVANMENLLQSNPVQQETPISTVDSSIFNFTPATPMENDNNFNQSSIEEKYKESESLLQPGKFFNLNSDGEIAETAAPSQSMETTPENISAMLNSAAVTPEPQQQVEEELSQDTLVSNNQVSSTSSMFGINLEPKNPDYVQNVEEKETNMDFGIPTPPPTNDTLNFDSFFQENQNTVTTEPVVEEELPISNNVENTPLFNQMDTPVSNNQSVESVVEPNIQQTPNTVNYSVPSAEELDAFLSNLDSTTPISSAMPETTPDPIVTVTTASQAVDVHSKMEQVKAIMSDAKQKIEGLGIKIELDEFDFDDMYQAIFKIDK